MKKTDLQALANISAGTLAKMGKNEPVSMKTLQSICKVLHCDFGDVIETMGYYSELRQ